MACPIGSMQNLSPRPHVHRDSTTHSLTKAIADISNKPEAIFETNTNLVISNASFNQLIPQPDPPQKIYSDTVYRVYPNPSRTYRDVVRVNSYWPPVAIPQRTVKQFPLARSLLALNGAQETTVRCISKGTHRFFASYYSMSTFLKASYPHLIRNIG